MCSHSSLIVHAGDLDREALILPRILCGALANGIATLRCALRGALHRCILHCSKDGHCHMRSFDTRVQQAQQSSRHRRWGARICLLDQDHVDRYDPQAERDIPNGLGMHTPFREVRSETSGSNLQRPAGSRVASLVPTVRRILRSVLYSTSLQVHDPRSRHPDCQKEMEVMCRVLRANSIQPCEPPQSGPTVAETERSKRPSIMWTTGVAAVSGEDSSSVH